MKTPRYVCVAGWSPDGGWVAVDIDTLHPERSLYIGQLKFGGEPLGPVVVQRSDAAKNDPDTRRALLEMARMCK